MQRIANTPVSKQMKNKSRPPSRIEKFKGELLISAVLAITVLLVFWPLFHCDFLNYDDDGYVTANLHVTSGLNANNLAWAFCTFDTANWHPLTWLSLMFDAKFFGNSSSAFHLTNLFLHVINMVLLFFILIQLTRMRWASAFVAALFGLHPLHVESVAWISERKDVLSGFFFMLTLLAYAQFAQKLKTGNPKSKIFYTLALLSFVLGLMSKPMLVTLPFVLLLLDYWPLRRFACSTIKRLVVEKVPFFALSIASGIVTFIAQKYGEAVQTLATFPVNIRIENAADAYVRYLGKCLYPHRLAVFYPYQSQWSFAMVISASALLVVFSLTVVLWSKKFPFIFVGWFWFLGMLIPVIGLVQVGQQSIADRYTYLPLIGIFIAVAWGIDEIARRWNLPKEILAVGAVVILIACAIQTRRQVSYWQNSETLFQHAIAVTKDNAEAWDHLGTYYLHDQNRVTDAANCFQHAVALAPNRISGRVNLGSIYLLQGKLDEAEQQLAEALRIDPSNPDANCDLGFIFASHGKWDDAIAHYNMAIQKKPDFASAFHNRGLAFAAENNWTNAIQDYRSAIQFDPNHASTHKHLGIALTHISQTNEAITELNRAIQLNPNDTEAAQQLESLQK